MTRNPSPEPLLQLARRRRLVGCAGALTLALGIAGVDVESASAKSETLHLFQQTVTNQFVNSAGKPIRLDPPKTIPTTGDRVESTDLDYVGTAAQHAKQWTASDHLSCTFTAPAVAICNAQIAIGGSLLLVTDESIHFGPGPVVLKVSGGTGAFAGAKGTITSVSVRNDANLTVSFTS